MEYNLSTKLKMYQPGTITHWCSACNVKHSISLKDGDKNVYFDYNDDPEKPTFSPDITQRFSKYNTKGNYLNPVLAICHYSIVKGIITYHDDCTHELAGTKMELQDMPIYNKRRSDA